MRRTAGLLLSHSPTVDSSLLFVLSFLFFLVVGFFLMDGRASPAPRRLKVQTPQPRPTTDPRRLHLQNIAQTTLDALDKGYIDEPLPYPNPQHDFTRHHIAKYLTQTQTYTLLYTDDAPELRGWQTPPPAPIFRPGGPHPSFAQIELRQQSTLLAARYLRTKDPTSRIGVLNFASATKPGGGFINGARAQEESIARSSSLYVSLTADAARPFYTGHARDERGGYYSHSMIYSPNIVVFRDDDGLWHTPYKLDIVTSPAVNAGQVRKTSRRSRGETEGRIQEVMRERMARILTLFERQRIRNLVLGSFGTGVFQNDVKTIASIWRDLLHGPRARFAPSFDTVVFAIPDTNTLAHFQSGFRF